MTTTTPDPRQFVVIKPLPIPKPAGDKLQARNDTVYRACHPPREQVFWENYRRRQRQLSRQGYRAAAWRPYEEVGQPLHLEPRRLILESLGQPEEEPRPQDAEPPPAEDLLISNPPPDSSAGRKQSVPPCRPQTRSREDTASLRKHLEHTRRLVWAVKQGRAYFHLLQEEEQRREEQRKGAWPSTEPRPPKSSSSDSDSDEWPLTSGAGCSSGTRPHRKKAQSARPFTPVHRSLTSPLLQEAPPEALLQQLFCLSWLLEALSQQRPGRADLGRAGPVSSCWGPRDPVTGGTRMRSLMKERNIQTRWEQFVSQPKPPRAGPRPPRSSSSSSSSSWLHLQKAASSSLLSSASYSSFSALGSLSSVGPLGSEAWPPLPPAEDSPAPPGPGGADPGGAGPPGQGGVEPDPPPSEYLRKLLDVVHQAVRRELRRPEGQGPSNGSLTDSLPSVQPLPQREATPTGSTRPQSLTSNSSLLVSSRASTLEQMRTSFQDRAEEQVHNFTSALELNTRKRLDSGLRRFRALGHVTRPPHHPPHRHASPPATEVTPPETTTTEKPCNNNNNNNNSNSLWLSSLLSSLPAEAGLGGGARGRRVLERLRRLAEGGGPPAVTAPAFLRVLGGLQPWELCLPHLCVAIEMVRDHVVQMSREDYDSWLSSRVSLPPQDRRGHTHLD